VAPTGRSLFDLYVTFYVTYYIAACIGKAFRSAALSVLMEVEGSMVGPSPEQLTPRGHPGTKREDLEMKARFLLTGLAVVMAATLFVPAAGAARPVAPGNSGGPEQLFIYNDFEKGVLEPWTPMTDSPFHGYKMAVLNGMDGCSPLISGHFARLVTGPNGKSIQAPAIIMRYGSWAKASFVVYGQGVRQVRLQWSARWSPDQVPTPLHAHAAVYAGLTAPTKGGQFAKPLNADLNYSWHTYYYTTYINLTGAATGTPVHIAFGWDNVNDSMDLNCLKISITYAVTGPTTK
jgi:hypothetical protein